MTIRFDGADLSHYQATIDWPTLRAASWWVATKATQGVNYTDPTFATHWAEMGVGFTHRLAYHWLVPYMSPAAQAARFLSVWDRTGGAMLDAEQGGITVADVIGWCEAVEAVTLRPVSVYTGAYVAGGTIWQSAAVRTSKYGPRPMHLAAYTTEAKALALPGVNAYPWDAWQYSSNGPVAGVAGRCDMNRVDNRPAYDLACGITSTGSTPPATIGDDDMAFISNKTSGKYGAAPSPQGGCTIWELTLGDEGRNHKRALSFPEWVAFGQPYGVACDDATLDALPDWVAAAAPLFGNAAPTAFTGSGTVTWTGKAS